MRKRKPDFYESLLFRRKITKEKIPIGSYVGWLLADIKYILKGVISKLLVLFFILFCISVIWLTRVIKESIKEYVYMGEDIAKASTEEDFITYNTSYIYDSDGNVLAELKVSGGGEYLTYDDIPKNVINAFIAVEDRTFWDNCGIDVKGILRVSLNFLSSNGDDVAGASTITQQLVRMKYLTTEVSMDRKFKEIFASIEITEKYSKKQIMEYYVNNCCFANNIYGIEEAADTYFGIHASELSLSQTAYLCAIPNRPTYYNPFKDSSRAMTRRDKILGDMLECEFITQEEYDKALQEEIQVIEREYNKINNYQTTFAIHCATKLLMQRNGFDFRYEFTSNQDYETYREEYNKVYEDTRGLLYCNGYKIYTSLDSSVQKEIQKIVDNELTDTEKNKETGIYNLQAAVTAIDNKTGRVIAVIGGRSQDETEDMYTYNRAYQSYRQPGSTIKPIAVYAPAFQKGYNRFSILQDIDVSEAKKEQNRISEMTGKSMILRKAVEKSKNGCAYYVMNDIGVQYGLSFLQRMQFDKIVPSDYIMSASLGGLTYGVTTVEMASAYATLENDGVFRGTTCITSMKDAQGNELFYQTKRVIYEETAAKEMIYSMQDVLKTGTAKNMNWSGNSETEASGKTGTTNNNKDGWFCGVTPYYSIAVWVGYDTPKTLSNLQGNTYPASIWKKSMLSLIDDLPKETFNFDYITDSTVEEKYLSGRDADELLSAGYTVQNYRDDHIIAEKVDMLICEILFLDKNSETYKQDKDAYYEQGLALIDAIYGNTLSKEKTKLLEDAYIQDEKIEKTVSKEPEEIESEDISKPEYGGYDMQDAIEAVG